MSDRFTNYPNSIGINGTEVAATATELNILSGVTATATEINYLDITTLGTGAASKAVVLDAGDDYTWPATGVLTYGVLKDSAATTITATGTEINYLDIAVLGTGAASKAVVLDTGEDYTWPATGILTYGVLKDSVPTTITATGAEINYLDIAVLGTGAASKAVVLDTGDDYTWPATGILTYGVLKDGPGNTTIVATGAEINRTGDVSSRIVSLSATTPITEAAHEAKEVVMATTPAAATTFTLPAATGGGARYRFKVGIVNVSNYVIQVANANDTIGGNILTNSTDEVAAADEVQAELAGATADTITLNGTTTGGKAIGDWIELVDGLANKWLVSGITTSTTAATPFSAAV